MENIVNAYNYVKNIFKKYKIEGQFRYKVKIDKSNKKYLLTKSSLNSLFNNKTIVKIDGKNGIPNEIKKFKKDLPKIKNTIINLDDDPMNIVIVFDGDNYEEQSTPFSILIKELASHVGYIVAVKNKANDYSIEFVENWLKQNLTNMLFIEITPVELGGIIKNDWNTIYSHYVINVYSELYKINPINGGRTTGYMHLLSHKKIARQINGLIKDIVKGVKIIQLKKTSLHEKKSKLTKRKRPIKKRKSIKK